MFDIEKTNRINLLIDIYQNLLTKKQLEYIELYFFEDLSLGEIAEEYSVSRNAVYDNIQRTLKQLDEYEEKLQLLSKYSCRKSIYEEMKHKFSDELVLKYIEKLENYE